MAAEVDDPLARHEAAAEAYVAARNALEDALQRGDGDDPALRERVDAAVRSHEGSSIWPKPAWPARRSGALGDEVIGAILCRYRGGVLTVDHALTEGSDAVRVYTEQIGGGLDGHMTTSEMLAHTGMARS